MNTETYERVSHLYYEMERRSLDVRPLDRENNDEDERERQIMERVSEYILNQANTNPTGDDLAAEATIPTTTRLVENETEKHSDAAAAAESFPYTCSPHDSSEEEVEEIFEAEIGQLFLNYPHSPAAAAANQSLTVVPHTSRPDHTLLLENKL